MIPLLLERLESLRRKYSEKVGKRKELRSTMKAQRRWMCGVPVSRFDIRCYSPLIISIGQWVDIVFSYAFLRFKSSSCHIDTAHLWPYRVAQQKIARSWSTQVDLMDRYPEFRFSCTSAQQYKWLEEVFSCVRDSQNILTWLEIW